MLVEHSVTMTKLQFEILGVGEVVYLKAMSAEEAQTFFPRIKRLPKRARRLFGLFGADGTPVACAEDINKVIAIAERDHLHMVAVS